MLKILEDVWCRKNCMSADIKASTAFSISGGEKKVKLERFK